MSKFLSVTFVERNGLMAVPRKRIAMIDGIINFLMRCFAVYRGPSE